MVKNNNSGGVYADNLKILIKIGVVKQLKADGLITDSEFQNIIRTFEQEYATMHPINGIEIGRWSV